MATIADLAIGLSVRAGPAIKGFARMTKSVRSFAGGIARAAARIGVFGAALGAVATGGGLVLLVKRQLAAIDSTAKLAARLGDTTAGILSMQHAAGLAGVETELFNKGLRTMVVRIGEIAALGTGEAQAAFEALGVNVEKLSKMAATGALLEISDAFQAIGNQAKQAALAAEIFGSRQVAFVNLLKQGKVALMAQQAEAAKLGLTVSEIGAALVQMANDALRRFTGLFTGIARTITTELAPFIKAVADKFTAMGLMGEGAAAKIRKAVRAIVDKALVFVITAIDRVPKFVAKMTLSFLEFTSKVMKSYFIMTSRLETTAVWKVLFGKEKVSGAFLAVMTALEVSAVHARAAFNTLNKETGSWADSLQRARDQLKGIRDAAADAAKAAEDMRETSRGRGIEAALKTRLDSLKSFAQSTIDSTRTSLEQYELTLGKLNAVLDEGLISWEIYARAIRLARGELESFKKSNVPATAALEQGTAAAFRAERQQFNPNKGESIGVILEQLKEAQEARKILQAQLEIMQKQEDSQVVAI